MPLESTYCIRVPDSAYLHSFHQRMMVTLKCSTGESVNCPGMDSLLLFFLYKISSVINSCLSLQGEKDLCELEIVSENLCTTSGSLLQEGTQHWLDSLFLRHFHDSFLFGRRTSYQDGRAEWKHFSGRISFSEDEASEKCKYHKIFENILKSGSKIVGPKRPMYRNRVSIQWQLMETWIL